MTPALDEKAFESGSLAGFAASKTNEDLHEVFRVAITAYLGAASPARAARVAELEAEVARLSKPEWFYHSSDPENTCSDLQHVAHTLEPGAIMNMAGARTVWKAWVALRVLTVDAQGEPARTDVAAFATHEEALRCWAESLAAARAGQRVEA